LDLVTIPIENSSVIRNPSLISSPIRFKFL